METETSRQLRQAIERLGPWFHNFHLSEGVQTAPEHFLGDFPLRKWVEIADAIPQDLTGWRCLDIGCNAGFYSFELAKRGGRVLGIDSEPLYLSQARWIAGQLGGNLRHQPEFRQMQIHDLARTSEKFDLVLFMGVFYHLRYPTLALDTVAEKVNKLMVFQTLTTEDPAQELPNFPTKDDYPITERKIFNERGWPKMAFIEKSYSNDATNWWVPNHAAVEAQLRSTGFEKIKRITHEVYFCEPPAQGVRRRRIWEEEEWASATGESRQERL